MAGEEDGVACAPEAGDEPDVGDQAA